MSRTNIYRITTAIQVKSLDINNPVSILNFEYYLKVKGITNESSSKFFFDNIEKPVYDIIENKLGINVSDKNIPLQVSLIDSFEEKEPASHEG